MYKEDSHIQIELKDSYGDEVKELLDYDIVVRWSEEEERYVCFELIDQRTGSCHATVDFMEVKNA